ncbi:MAG: diguanylate cyclase [Longicatena sp.]
MKKTTDKNKVMIKTILILLLVVFVGFSFFDYDAKNRNSSEIEMKSAVERNNLNINIAIQSKLQDIQQVLYSYAAIASHYNSLFDPAFLEFLENRSPKDSFDSLCVTTSEGISYTSKHTTHDSSNSDFFIEGMKGNSYISDLTHSHVDNKKVVIVSVPIIKEEKVKGVVYCTYSLASIEKLLDLAPSDGVETMIVQYDGSALTRTSNMNMANYFDFLATAELLDGASLSQIKIDFKNGNKGILRYRFINKTRYCFYSPIKGTNWLAITILPYQLINNQIYDSYKATFYLSLKLGFCFILILAYNFINERKNTKYFSYMNKELDAIIGNTPGCMVRYEVDNPKNTMFINKGFKALCGYSEEEFRTLLEYNYFKIVHKNDIENLLKQIDNNRENNDIHSYTYRIINKNGNIQWIFERRKIVKDEHNIKWYYITLVDITETKKIENKLKVSQNRYQMIIEQTEFIVFEWDIQKDVLILSDLWMNKFGTKTVYNDFLATTEEYFADEEHSYIPLLESFIHGKTQGQCECQLKDKDGNYLWVKITARSFSDASGYLMSVFGSIEDINDLKAKTIQLEEKAKIDGMTRVLNKVTVESLIENALLSHPDKKHILLVLDVDDFKDVNDTLGHAAGDKVLCEIAESIRTCFRTDDFVGRIGGDEFIVFMKDVGNTSSTFFEHKMKRLYSSFEMIYIASSPTYRVTCSTGIAYYPEDGISYEDLFNHADTALYEAKKQGKNHYCVYQSESEKKI